MKKLWERTPGAWRAGMIIAIVGQFCSISSSSTRTVGGQVVECSYLDYGKVAFGLIVLVLAVAGWSRHRTQRPKLPDAAVIVIPLVMVVLAVLLVLRGLGIILNPCDDLTSAAALALV